MNEVVNGIFEADALGNVALGILNAGTGCDCARTLGIPHECKAACERLLNPKMVAVDLGVAEFSTNGRLVRRAFLNNAGLGLDAEVVKTMARRFRVPGRTLRYLIAVIATLASFRNRHVEFSLDGELHSQKVCMLGAN
ncbi:MAG: diacylglycerol kinase family protein, partial [Chloroflexota bacterium]